MTYWLAAASVGFKQVFLQAASTFLPGALLVDGLCFAQQGKYVAGTESPRAPSAPWFWCHFVTLTLPMSQGPSDPFLHELLTPVDSLWGLEKQSR